MLVCAGLAAACGKKGPPLAPLARVPAAPGDVQAARAGDEVYIWFTVPSANVSGQTPADLASLDLFAFTGVRRPEGEDLTEVAVKIASFPVQPVLPPPPVLPEGAPPLPSIPVPPGFAQGAAAVVRETLTPETAIPTPVAVPTRPEVEVDEAEPVFGPLVAPAPTETMRRHYFVVAVSARGRASAPSGIVSVPIDAASGAPSAPVLSYTESEMTMAWTAPVDARAAAAADEPGLLPARPIVPLPAPTTYHVFEVPREPAPVDPFAIPLPAPLTPQPVPQPVFAVPGAVRFGVERCFVVRAVDTVAGSVVLGPASEPGCLTPEDTFPPAAPQQLVAISGIGVINLIWEPNTEPDLAGYIVLRGTAPGDTLQALTPAPIRETTYRDQTAEPGVRYVYAVVAVDNATPQNVSGQSNRVEDASREP